MLGYGMDISTIPLLLFQLIDQFRVVCFQKLFIECLMLLHRILLRCSGLPTLLLSDDDICAFRAKHLLRSDSWLSESSYALLGSFLNHVLLWML